MKFDESIFDKYIKRLLTQYSHFFENIPKITYVGSETDINNNFPATRTDNITELELDIEDMSTVLYSTGNTLHCGNLPTSL